MGSWTGEEIAEGLERWLKKRRDERGVGLSSWAAIDALLDEARDAAVEGWLPWQRINRGD